MEGLYMKKLWKFLTKAGAVGLMAFGLPLAVWGFIQLMNSGTGCNSDPDYNQCIFNYGPVVWSQAIPGAVRLVVGGLLFIVGTLPFDADAQGSNRGQA
jgi:hypothetical protein